MTRLLLALAALAVFSACTTTPTTPGENVDSYAPPPRVERPQDLSYRINLQELQSKLRMARAVDDLGFAEKPFDPCTVGVASRDCGRKHFSVVHFQLLCRDSEGSVSEAPIQLTPLTSDRVTWKIGAYTGSTQTDGQGYGQFLMLSKRSVRGQRLTLRIGRQFMGFTVSDVSKVVLPKNFCE